MMAEHSRLACPPQPQPARGENPFPFAPAPRASPLPLAPYLIALTLSACAGLDGIAPATPAAPAPREHSTGRSPAEELVDYLARLRAMSDSGLSAEAARQRQAAARQPSDVARLKVALALALAPQSDEADILAVVEPLARKDADSEVRAMAGFLHAIVTERRRLKESAATVGARLREERRAHEAQRQRADALQQKLEALTELEKSLSNRDNPPR
ncbi:MAG TPA: hypothetical protein VN878_01545 [Usitatibacter sp.]|nr:hypothetical protein [Usitatibacter sp.]